MNHKLLQTVPEGSEMGTQEGEMFRHDTARVAGMIGNGLNRQVIRRWARNKRISGVYQREENAKVWLNDQGVLEVWTLWAEYQDLDPEKDMPTAVQKLRNKMRTAEEASTNATKDERLSVTIILPPGAHLQIVQQG